MREKKEDVAHIFFRGERGSGKRGRTKETVALILSSSLCTQPLFCSPLHTRLSWGSKTSQRKKMRLLCRKTKNTKREGEFSSFNFVSCEGTKTVCALKARVAGEVFDSGIGEDLQARKKSFLFPFVLFCLFFCFVLFRFLFSSRCFFEKNIDC